MELNTILMALALTIMAGISTGLGGILVLFGEESNKRMLSTVLGFSAGVMLYVSFIELYPQSQKMLSALWGPATGNLITTASFFGGILLIGLIDLLVPSEGNPHEAPLPANMEQCKNRKLLHTGYSTALVIAIHNFPEGLATFSTSLNDSVLGFAIAVAIALHNIPEGISVAVPIYCATGNRKKAFLFALLSGLSEPLGAMLGFAVLLPFMSETLFGVLYAAVTGIMVFISLDKLLPEAREHDNSHLSIYGLVAGMLVMAVSIMLLP